jgi:glyoxylate carboligase
MLPEVATKARLLRQAGLPFWSRHSAANDCQIEARLLCNDSGLEDRPIRRRRVQEDMVGHFTKPSASAVVPDNDSRGGVFVLWHHRNP